MGMDKKNKCDYCYETDKTICATCTCWSNFRKHPKDIDVKYYEAQMEKQMRDLGDTGKPEEF